MSNVSGLILPKVADFLKRNNKSELRFAVTWSIPRDESKSNYLWLFNQKKRKSFGLNLEIVSDGKDVWLEQDRQMPVPEKDKYKLLTSDKFREKYKRHLSQNEYPKLYKMLPAYFEKLCKEAKII